MRAPEMAARSSVKVSGMVVDSPGARLLTREAGVWKLTPGVGLSHFNSAVAERAVPMFQNLSRA